MGKDGLLWAFRHYSVPSAFLDERLRSVTHSFGAQSDAHGKSCALLVFTDLPMSNLLQAFGSTTCAKAFQ
jgi:hypothetical protein